MKSPAFWYRPAGAVAGLLEPLSYLWRGGTALRRLQAKPYQARKPVICVGNIVAGGAGKTPSALAIAKLLKQAGQNPVFVTRGYGGNERGPMRVDPDRHTASDVGDEALLLARLAPVWVGRDRVAAIQQAEQQASHVILDDGLQNPNVKPDFSFLVIDGETGFGNERIIPAGPLREPLGDALQRVTAVILIGARDVHNIAARLSCPVFHATIQPALPDSFPHGDKFFAFAGIGHPGKFFATCREAGLTIAGTKDFPDHHAFTPGDMAALRDDAKRQNARLLTTEKDWVRLPKDFRDEVTALPVTLALADASAMERLLTNKI